jgi:hypothetical protein
VECLGVCDRFRDRLGGRRLLRALGLIGRARTGMSDSRSVGSSLLIVMIASINSIVVKSEVGARECGGIEEGMQGTALAWIRDRRPGFQIGECCRVVLIWRRKERLGLYNKE